MSEKNLVLSDDLFEKLPEDDKNSEFIAVAIKTFAKDAWDRFRRNKLALGGLIFLIIMIVLAIVVPAVAPYQFDTQDMANRNALPSLQHLFGTDKLGRDIFVRVMYGARVSLAIGFSTAAINLVIGILYGGISGYVGGRVDMIMMRIVDIIYAVPSLIYVVLILLVFGDSVGSMMLAICLTSWIGMARQVRTQIMSLKEMEFSLAAKVIGASNSRILIRHLVINALGPIIVSLTMMVPGAIFTEASLSFVGIGLNPAIPSWGKLANDCRQLIFTQPLQVLWPVAAISLTILALNFVGDGIGEAFQARTR
ncbi:MAG: ABC transporter permease [Erysipelotrichaceae bacterium]|nr:ABC transporter permease [Erysipelotrichaceae bacterium]MBR6233494.1 ABC transporter permease [Erysipelotrichaceae bacterium]